jgi:CheY-like chemotaxis protein
MAVNEITTEHFDLLLLDLSLDPEKLYKFGREILVTLRSRMIPIPPTIVVSGSEDFENILELFNEFRDCVIRFVPKPAFQKLISRSDFNRSVSRALADVSTVVSILSRFEDGLKRWRWDDDTLRNPIRWKITGEREVQDIVWLILRPYFQDLVDEETLPKFGHSSYRPDFAIPSLRLLIEVKYAYRRTDFREIEHGIMQDSIGYLIQTDKYSRIVVFIYDSSASVQEHAVTRDALTKISGLKDIIIVCRPSQLDAP